MNTAAELAEYMRRHIPLSQAMAVTVEAWDGDSLCLSAPLELNHNDKGSAFAGSIGGLASLAGWGLVMLWSDRLGPCQAAIARAEVEYCRPLRGRFRAEARLPGSEAQAGFHERFERLGRARLPVRIEVLDGDGVGAVQQAEYAIWRWPA